MMQTKFLRNVPIFHLRPRRKTGDLADMERGVPTKTSRVPGLRRGQRRIAVDEKGVSYERLPGLIPAPPRRDDGEAFVVPYRPKASRRR